MTQPIPEGWTAFVYVLKGDGDFGGDGNWTSGDAHHTLVLGKGDHVEAKNTVGEHLVGSVSGISGYGR